MARPTNRARLTDLVDDWAPKLKKAFLDAIADITSSADLGRMVRSIEAGDVEDALRAAHLDPASFRPVDIAIAEAVAAGGGYAVNRMPLLRDTEGHRVVFRFDVRNPRAETYLQSRSSELVTEILSDQRTAIRAALRAGMEAGQNPRSVALDIVGRIDTKTGRRSGGVVGLTSMQEQFARNYRLELLSGDPAAMQNALKRELRDRRFDATVRQAIADGKPLSLNTVDKLVTRYRASLLRLRGETIGRTEALTSLHVGQNEAYQQAIESGAVQRSHVRKVWSATGDSRVRHTHRILDGQKVPLDGTFLSPSGARLRFPGDPNAPAAEIINCRCAVEYDIDFLAGG